MTPSKDSPRVPSEDTASGNEKPPNRRASAGFDARDVLAGRVDDTTVSQAVEGRR